MRTEEFERGSQHILNLIGEQLFDDYNGWDETRQYEALRPILDAIKRLSDDSACWQRLKAMKVDEGFVLRCQIQSASPYEQVVLNTAIKLAESQEGEGK